jgi:hypothetical protein
MEREGIDMDIEEQYKWVKKGKMYKAKYLAALKDLYSQSKEHHKFEQGKDISKELSHDMGSDKN